MKFVIALLVLFVFCTLPAFAQDTALISVTTDSSSYKEGSIIVVSGKVETIIGDTPVLLQIVVEGNIIQVDQITVAQDGNYSTTINAEGPQWIRSGSYIVRVSYGADNIAEKEFEFIPKAVGPPKTQMYEVNAGSYGTFDIDYSISGGILKEITIEPENYALVVTIESSEKGSILLKIPRESFDAKKQDGIDEVFIVLIDQIPVKYEEDETDPNYRIMTINFEAGDSSIKIIGTTIIPEFGTVTIMILVIGFVTIIVTRNKFQKYF